jgi:hypothetical protein
LIQYHLSIEFKCARRTSSSTRLNYAKLDFFLALIFDFRYIFGRQAIIPKIAIGVENWCRKIGVAKMNCLTPPEEFFETASIKEREV